LRKSFAGLAAIAVAVALAVPFGATAADDYQHLNGTVRTPEDPGGYAIDVFRFEGVDYLDLNEVARIFRGTKYWRAELEKMVLKIEGHRVRVTVGSRYVFVDDTGRNLLAPVRWHEGRIVVPMSLATGVLDELVTENVSWDRARRTFRVVTGDPNILTVDYDVRRNGTIVEFRLTESLRGEVEFPRTDRVAVKIPGGVLSDRLLGRFAAIGLVDSLFTAQEPGMAILTFQFGLMGGTAEALTRRSPPRLLVAISEGTPDDIPLPDFERRDPEDVPTRDVQRVVLDPGHGGSDPGILAATGVAEKEISLAIAQSVKRILEEEAEMEVYLTREDDRFLSAESRTELANGWRPDLLVSIHCNGWFQPGMRGFSVGVFPRGAIAEEEDMLAWGTRSPRAAEDSEMLAEVILEGFEQDLGRPNRGLRRESYAVLEGATMPAVHVECGFLTNREEGTMLSDPANQEGVASALALAIQEYRHVVRDGRAGTP
jgi:N-acetylmuramoyl-L-alanine amidase